MKGYLRSDGRKGIRNVIVVAYLVECAHHVARRIVEKSARDDGHLIGFPGCYPNAYALRMMKALCTHPNVGGVLLVSLGCEQIMATRAVTPVVGSAIAPVIKICANPDTYRRMSEDMDIDAGRVLDGEATLEEVGREIFATVVNVASDQPTQSETMGHQEFILTYKSFEPVGPACLPNRARVA